MEFKNKTLTKMHRAKRKYNGQFGSWYYRKYLEIGGIISENTFVDDEGVERKKLYPTDDPNIPPTMFNRGDRISSCMDYWVWDKYEKNKLLDLQKVNRCKNRAFCPNCKMLSVSRFIHEFRNQMPSLIGYVPYMITLTIPSIPVDGKAFSDTLEQFSSAFNTFCRKLMRPKITPTGRKSSQALQCRYFDMVGGVRVLEVTCSDKSGLHPHYHIIIYVREEIAFELLEKKHLARWNTETEKRDYKSDVEVQIGKLWSMLWAGLSLQNWDKIEFDPSANYLKKNGVNLSARVLEVDLRPLDESGIYEVFKYTFKNSEVKDYTVFKALVDGLERRRFRQGFGCLYGLKCDDDDEGEYQELKLDIEEDPETLVTKEISELVAEFRDYKKISRFNKGSLIDSIPD